MMTVDELYNRLRVLRASGAADQPVKIWIGEDRPRGVAYNVTSADVDVTDQETWLEISQEDA